MKVGAALGDPGQMNLPLLNISLGGTTRSAADGAAGDGSQNVVCDCRSVDTPASPATPEILVIWAYLRRRPENKLST